MATTAANSDSSVLRSLQFRLDLEKLLTSLSTRFINIPVEAVDDSLVEALGEVGEYTKVDRGFIFRFEDERLLTASMTHEWCASGIPSAKESLQKTSLLPLAWLLDQLKEGRIVHVPRVDDLPPLADGLRHVSKKLGVRSSIFIPMFSLSRMIGMLGFSRLRREEPWSDESISLLRVMGEIFGNAVARKHADQRLRESEERYRSVVEDQTDLIVRWKPDGTHTFVNMAVCRFFRKTHEELMNENVLVGVHQDDVEEVRKKVAALTPEHPTATDEHRVVLSDGEVFWHEWTDRAIFDQSGVIQGYQSVGRDITPKKRAQAELDFRLKFENLLIRLSTRFINVSADRIDEELSTTLRRVGEFSNADRSYVYLLDDSGDAAPLAFSWAAEGMPPLSLGSERLELCNYPWAIEQLRKDEPFCIRQLSDLPDEAKRTRESLAEGGVRSFIHVPMLSGKKLIGLLGVSNVKTEQSWSEEGVALLRLAGKMFVNALERKKNQLHLQDNEERLRLTIGALADGFHDWNVPTGEVYFSDYCLTLFGLPKGENWSRIENWLESVHPKDQPGLKKAMQDHFEGRTPVFEYDFRLQRPGDTYRWHRSRGRVISRDHQGNPLRMVGMSHDIDAEVVTEERLRKTESQLAHLARVSAMGEIVAGIAHEVNQPLHAAATFATATVSALESDDTGSRGRALGMVKKISGQVTRAADIIRRLRSFTQPRPAQLGRFDLNSLVRESAELLAAETRRRQVQLEFDFDESLPLLLGDRVQIQQVLVNLLRNAYDSIVEANRAKPLVAVTTRRTESGVQASVRDNGGGPPAKEEDLARLFDSFFTTKGDGMGIGLALCRSIVDAHGGKIWGEPNREEGMTFSFFLPLKEGTLSHEPKRTSA